jgi:hypothetical protein
MWFGVNVGQRHRHQSRCQASNASAWASIPSWCLTLIECSRGPGEPEEIGEVQIIFITASQEFEERPSIQVV